MRPRHYYHLHCGHGHVASRWEIPAEEHFGTLINAGCEGKIDVHVGITGDADKRFEAQQWLNGWWPGWRPAVYADDGYEQSTIRAMHRWAIAADPATPVYYSHGKGAFQDTPFNHNWRRAMDDMLIGELGVPRWEGCVEALAQYEYNVVACHWLTHDEFPKTITEGKPMAGGNFWWTTAGYLARLKPVEGGDPLFGYNRYKAEEWIGSGNPYVLDVKPGWPDYEHEGGYNSAKGGRIDL